MLVQRSSFVIGSFENGGTSHRRLGSGDDGEVLAGDAQKDLPCQVVSSSLQNRRRDSTYMAKRNISVDESQGEMGWGD